MAKHATCKTEGCHRPPWLGREYCCGPCEYSTNLIARATIYGWLDPGGHARKCSVAPLQVAVRNGADHGHG